MLSVNLALHHVLSHDYRNTQDKYDNILKLHSHKSLNNDYLTFNEASVATISVAPIHLVVL